MYTIENSTDNKDLYDCLFESEAKAFYLDLYGNFDSSLPEPEFYPSKERKDIFILDFSKGSCGFKAYAAEKFIANLKVDRVGYAAPRVGHAAEAIAYLCEVYNKKAVFFAPASKEVSAHQAVVLCYKNSELRFARIPAMPTLNAWIRGWADRTNSLALPFGLSGVKEVTAGIVKMADNHMKKYEEPPEFYCAVSTGTMIRGLQIGWPNSYANGIAVARNIKKGEKGLADVISYHKSFYEKSDYMPDFDTTATYDAKAYKHFIDNAKPGSVFINVGSDKQIEKRLENFNGWKHIDSKRDWSNRDAFNA